MSFAAYLPFAAVFGLGAGLGLNISIIGRYPLPARFHAAAGSQADFSAVWR